MTLVVNGEPLNEDAIQQECEFIRQRLKLEMPGESDSAIATKAREWATDNAIERILLRQAAQTYRQAETPLSHEPGTTEIPGSDPSEDVLIQRLLETVTAEVASPSRKEVVEFYQKNKSLFLAPEAVRASHIVKNIDELTTESVAYATISKAQADLRNGKLFREVAIAYSDCPGSGELGWCSRGEMVDEFDAVVFQLRPGEVSGIFRSVFGYHLATVHERKRAAVQPLHDVYPKVEQVILNNRKQESIERFLDRLRMQADIRPVTTQEAKEIVVEQSPDRTLN